MCMCDRSIKTTIKNVLQIKQTKKERQREK